MLAVLQTRSSLRLGTPRVLLLNFLSNSANGLINQHEEFEAVEEPLSPT